MSPLVVSALLLGLLGGGHCVAMCGGLASVVCSAAPRCPSAQAGTAMSRAPFWLAYNVGRVASYTAIGLLLGALGGLVYEWFPLDAVRYGLRVFAALSMLAVGLHLMGIFAVPAPLSRAGASGASLWRSLSPLTRRLLPLQRPRQALALGALWGFMPCGLLYGAFALSASAESALEGAATMAGFGAGTLPVMLTTTALAQTVARQMTRRWVRRAAGVVVLGLGLSSTAAVARHVGLGVPLGAHHCCPTHEVQR